MKRIVLVITLLLVAGIFATTFVLAEENTNTDVSQNVSQIETTEVTNQEMQETTSEIAEQTVKFKRIGFTEIWRGSGWITNDNNGYLISGFWAHQAYTKQNASDVKHLSYGRLHIAKVGNYRLVKTVQSEIAENIEFYLVPIGIKIKSVEEAQTNSVGTLSLTKISEYSNLVRWDGTLELKSGSAQGTYNVELGTVKYNVRPIVAAAAAGAIKDARQAGKISFWKRVQFWKRNQA